ncbi:hypothetical protein LTR84_011254 [Exophiala bonariae]|uniref:DUF4604 domain-containing protein n=1 Tax=Exophiala bonariae TaxID=1690606 RepID=A0AAV9MSF2_9EURO|nr:hypothetical protein LTR84_011254 [Exophiala bonariae]
MAFNAKNLQYNKQEPAFLRRLKGDYVGQDGRQTYQAPRPKRDRLKAGDDDDDPVIVDEQGETVAKEEFERRVNGDKPGEALATTVLAEDDTQGELEHGKNGTENLEAKNHERQKVSEVGGSAASKKRKVGKVVGGDEDLQESVTEVSKNASKLSRPGDEAVVSKNKDMNAAKKKKGKKIKLSFDEPDG